MASTPWPSRNRTADRERFAAMVPPWAPIGPPLPPRPRAPRPRLLDREQARDAYALAHRIGVHAAAAELGWHLSTLYKAWRRYGIPPPCRPGRARAAKPQVRPGTM